MVFYLLILARYHLHSSLIPQQIIAASKCILLSVSFAWFLLFSMQRMRRRTHLNHDSVKLSSLKCKSDQPNAICTLMLAHSFFTRRVHCSRLSLYTLHLRFVPTTNPYHNCATDEIYLQHPSCLFHLPLARSLCLHSRIRSSTMHLFCQFSTFSVQLKLTNFGVSLCVAVHHYCCFPLFSVIFN